MTPRHLSALDVLSAFWIALATVFQLHLSHSFVRRREPFVVSQCAEEEHIVGGGILSDKGLGAPSGEFDAPFCQSFRYGEWHCHRSCIHASCTRTLPFAETFRQVTCSGYNTRYDRWYVLFGNNCIQPFFFRSVKEL